jgi:hypothetical protein
MENFSVAHTIDFHVKGQIVNYSEISDEAFSTAYIYDQPNEALYIAIPEFSLSRTHFA